MMPTRVDYDDEWVREQPLEYWQKSICIFDDIEDLGSKESTKFVKGLQALMYTAGRKLNIFMVNTMHNFRGGQETALAKLENNWWVFAARGSPKFKLVGVLVDLLGMKRRQAEITVKQLGDSRHVFIHTHFPNLIMSSNMMQLL